MKPVTIATLTEESLGLPISESGIKHFAHAARVLVYNNLGQIAMYRPGPARSYRMPGGKVEPKETLESAAIRETVEEIGAKIELKSGPLAQIVCRKNVKRTQQTDVLFLAQYKTSVSRRRGRMLRAKYNPPVQQPIWATPRDALSILAEQTPKKYKDKFVRARDMKFLEYAVENNLVPEPKEEK